MELEVIEEKADSMTFVLKGEQHTFPALICWALLKDSKVKVAVYDVPHPLVGKPKIHLKTAGKKPRKAVADALAVIEKELNAIKKGLPKQKG